MISTQGALSVDKVLFYSDYMIDITFDIDIFASFNVVLNKTYTAV